LTTGNPKNLIQVLDSQHSLSISLSPLVFLRLGLSAYNRSNFLSAKSSQKRFPKICSLTHWPARPPHFWWAEAP